MSDATKTGATLRDAERALADLVEHLDVTPARLRAALAAVRARIAADDTVVCAFCPHTEPRLEWERARVQMAKHIAGCAAHPMRAAVLDLERLREELREQLAVCRGAH